MKYEKATNIICQIARQHRNDSGCLYAFRFIVTASFG